MLLYADEDFPLPAVEQLRKMGHDVLKAQGDGLTSTLDSELLARAHGLGRVLLTYNRRHFERLHRQGVSHSGILSGLPTIKISLPLLPESMRPWSVYIQVAGVFASINLISREPLLPPKGHNVDPSVGKVVSRPPFPPPVGR